MSGNIPGKILTLMVCPIFKPEPERFYPVPGGLSHEAEPDDLRELLNRDSERIPRRLSARSRDPAGRGRGEG